MHTRIKKIFSLSFAAMLLATLFAGSASAHVVVRPAEVPTASFQTFTLSVPNEKNQSNTIVKVIIPAGVNHVTPTVKQGWQIKIEKSGEGDAATVASITWSGNVIPAGFRDDFTFSAQAPAKAGNLQWKAYQTYADGSVISWDQTPTSNEKDDDSAKAGPFSLMKVTATEPQAASANTAPTTDNRALYAAIAGIVLGLAALFMATRKKQ